MEGSHLLQEDKNPLRDNSSSRFISNHKMMRKIINSDKFIILWQINKSIVNQIKEIIQINIPKSRQIKIILDLKI